MPHLSDQVHLALEQSPFLSGRQLRFEADEGRVTLHGIVGSYYQKQIAQELVRSVDGVSHIENHLEVRWAPSCAGTMSLALS